jgi:D-alanyl-D-alanine carboxypeptidase
VCLRRNAAAIAAAEEEVGSEFVQTAPQGRGLAVVAVAAGGAPFHTELSDVRPHFDPIPVYIGPVAGWTGPVLGPRPAHASAAGLPADAKAYSGEIPDKIEEQASPGAAPSAPTVLNGAVRTPAPGVRRPRHAKPVVARKEVVKPASMPGAKHGGEAKPAKSRTIKQVSKGASSD